MNARARLRSALLAWVSIVIAPAAQAKELYVSPEGDDATSYANNSETTPWATIGRAAWGSTDRASPNAPEAVHAGDTVIVAGGTYSYAGTIADRFDAVYNPVNSGSSSALITFTCAGDCTLEAPSADSPVIGASGRDYVKWFADVSSGHSWVIPACGLMVGCGSNVVNTTPDTGPVVCSASTGCWVEGALIDGGPPIDYADNWNAFRLENCSECTIRNNTASNFTRDPSAGNTNHNQSIITMYGTLDSVIEHNFGSNAGSGVFFKDTANTNPQSGNQVRFNHFDSVGEVIAFSVTAEGPNHVYQNIGTNSGWGLTVVGGGLAGDWVFNNTFHNLSFGFVSPSQAGAGGSAWNNICVGCDRIVYVNNGSMVSDAVLDVEHNLYQGYTQFYEGTDGTLTFAGFQAAYPDQDQSVPASLTADPVFVDELNGDFRLCTGAGEPVVGCSGASPALALGVDLLDLNGSGNSGDAIPAGAFVTGSEVIGPGASPAEGGGGGGPTGGAGGGAEAGNGAGAGVQGGAGAGVGASGGGDGDDSSSASGCDCRSASQPERLSWWWAAAAAGLAFHWRSTRLKRLRYRPSTVSGETRPAPSTAAPRTPPLRSR